MKILRLRFKNLNSLEGEWSIDFTHPSYEADGLFAITGPTGSGKTTVLDSVCLALFGKTPRLGNVTKATNEIMSRNTGECFSELVFSTTGGTFCAHWSQHRARKSPRGPLQAPRHELSKDGKIIQDKPSKMTGDIQKIIGMDFVQFTRSVLLAQGGFAAFLNAPPDERSPILEQITGTEIYSEISIAVHLRTSSEEERLGQLNSKLDSTLPLPEEKLDELKNQLDRLKMEDEKLSGRVRLLQQALGLLQKKEEAISRKHQDRTELVKIRESLAKNKLKMEQAKEQHTVVRQSLEAAESRKTEMEPVIDQALELDARIASIGNNHQQLKIQIDELQEKTASQTRQRDELDKDLKDAKLKLSNIERYLAKNENDSLLITTFASIEKTFLDIDRLRDRRNEIIRKLQAAEKNLADAKSESAKVEKQKKSMEAVLTKANKDRLEQWDNYRVSLAGKDDITQWFSEKENIQKKVASLEELKKIVGQLNQFVSNRKSNTRTLQKLDKSISELSGLIQESEKDLSACCRELDLLQDKLTLEQNVASLEEQRKNLEEGKPCPLCGATHHPLVQDGMPQPSNTKKQLEQATSLKQALDNQLTSHKVELGKLITKKHNAEERIQDLTLQMDCLISTIENSLEVLDIEPLEDNAIPGLDRRISKLKTDLEACDRKTKNIQALNKLYSETEKKLQQAQQDFDECNKILHEATLSLQKAQAGRDSLDEQLRQAQASLERLMEDAGSELEMFGINRLRPENLDEVLQSLSMRKKAWEEKSREKSLLEKKSRDLAGEKNAISILLEDIQQHLEQVKQQARAAEQKTASLEKKRKQLLGDKDPRKFSELLSQKLTEAHQSLDAAISSLHDAEKTRAKLTENKKGLEKAMADRLDEIEHIEESLTKMLNEAHLQGGMENNKVHGLLKTAMHETEENFRRVQQNRGALEQRLADNTKLEHSRMQQEKLVRAQQDELARWQRLHNLIGSSNGKKFRNFAQGLTFQSLIHNANQQLELMSDRYVLIPDENKPLELMVLDGYQGGEVRTTKNLSGGESFIVSLALALGLANMASKNIQVDSLFLDEGFGTLDDDALDVALDTLSSLQQNGKVIGLISHVSAIKERMTTRIELTPLTGGRSKLEGPGCERRHI